jgi:hypothetical protein
LGQKNALSGAHGTPGSGNEFLTKQSLAAAGAPGKALTADDPVTTNARPPIPHTHPATDITGLPSGGGQTNVKLTADLPATTAVALTNTTGLAFPVVAGVYYRFDALVIFRSAALTTGLRLGASVPAFTVFSAVVDIPIAGDGPDASIRGQLTTSGDSVLGTGVQAINTDYVATLSGILLPSANGTFQLQHATEIAGSAITIRRGSVLSYSAV